MPIIISGNLVSMKIRDGISPKTGEPYRMVTGRVMVDIGNPEDPQKEIYDFQADKEFPEEAVNKFVAQFQRDNFQRVELWVRNLSSRAYGNGAQTAISVEFLNPRIEIPKKVDEPKATAQTETKSPDKPSEKSEAK